MGIIKKPDLGIFDKRFPFQLKSAEIYDPTKFTILTGTDGVLDDLFSYQVFNWLKNTWYAGAAPADMQDGMMWVDSGDGKLHLRHGGGLEEVLQLTRSFDVTPRFAGVGLMDTDDSHYLVLKCNEDLTGNKFLNFVTGDASRTITLSGSPTMGDWFDQSVKQAASPTFNAPIVSNLNVGEYIYHTGDVDTYIRFQLDNLTLRAGGIDFVNMVEAATDYLQLLSGLNFIGDNVNTKMTRGLTINQLGADDEIFARKSSDVAHGVTDYAETDTYGLDLKAHSTEGGLEIRGLSGGERAINLVAYYTTDDTGKDVNANAPIQFNVYKKSGTGRGNMGADANAVAIKVYRGGASDTVWILDEDGDIWQDGNLYIGGGNDATLESGDILYLEAGADGIYSLRIRDTVNAEAPNVYIGGVTGKLFRTTAGARKYKANIKDLELDSSGIYDFRPISFTSKCKDDDKNKRFVGLNADEVEQIYPSIIEYDDKNEPETINYRAIQILMLAALQKQKKEIDALKAKLNN